MPRKRQSEGRCLPFLRNRVMVLRQFVTNPTKELAMDSSTLVFVATEIFRSAMPVFIIYLAILGLYYALDRLFLPKYRLEGRVDFRRHYPGVLDPAHELFSPQTDRLRPDRWYVFVSANAESWPIPIDAKGFSSVSPGDTVMIELSYGRFTGKRYGVRLIGRS